MNIFFKNTSLVLIFVFLVNTLSFSQTTKKQDTIQKKKDTTKLKYNFNYLQNGGLFLKGVAKKVVFFDALLNQYVIVEKIGDSYTRTPIYMTPKEYEKYRLQQDILDYFKEKVSATNSKKKGAKDAQKNLLPTYYVNSKFFSNLFGGNKIEINPSGSLNLKLGAIYQNTENPQVSEENRSSFTLDFDQQIGASLQAKIGERLALSMNYDTQATFDFQNLVKIEFTPTEDDIIQGIEAGNVSMPIKNSLINGAQSLFGAKTQLKFGNTNITAVFSQQNSESKTITTEGGASIQPFELRVTDYDENRHFFLSHFFRNNYANSVKNYPLISSQVNITRIEVWITNRNSSINDYRSIVAFSDLGESEEDVFVNQKGGIVSSPDQAVVSGKNLPFNEANTIYTQGILEGIRDISTVEASLNSLMMAQGQDYSLLQSARKLDPSEFTLNSQLGFISLNRKLNDGEILAVAYEYTVAGNIAGSSKNSFKVGEFSNEGILTPNNLAVKLLRSEILQTKRTNKDTGKEEAFPTWQLMMKNIYALGAFPLTQDGFRFEIQYRDDQTGIASNTLQNAKTPDISNKPLLQVLKLDQLDQSQFQNADGFFDYIEGITVSSENGYIIFPEPEPFGNDLKNKLTSPIDIDHYVFDELYLNVKVNAQNNFQNKDKFLLKGYFKSENSGGISIGAFNVPRGSVKVTTGGRQLVEGVDFVVDYLQGKVQIIDPGLLSSGAPINIATENNSVFNQQRKTFMGIDVEHKFSENFVAGATLLNVNERPITPKVNFGSEPINNTMFGINVDYSMEAPFLTKLANKLPFVDTDSPSNISVRADMAYLLPGTPSGIDVAGAATSYIDDFEASQVPISLLSPLQWHMASTPDTPTFPGFNAKSSNSLEYNYQRAKLAWYTIDQLFYGAGATPANIDAKELSRSETRQINYTELFPNQQLDITQNTLIRTLDLAYFPAERGPYNFDPNAKFEGENVLLENPESRWAGIMRSLTTNNFNQANVEYIQFWMMDPYQNYLLRPEEGLPAGINPKDPSNQVGDLYINLGNISEDILKDNRKMYENGLPEVGGTSNTISTVWGKAPTNQSIIYAFNEDDASRKNQDVGLDGINDADEQEKSKLNIPQRYKDLADPAGDDFQYYRGKQLDESNASIISRYKNYNNTERNSPTINQSTESFPTSSSTYPDTEDINKDQTMNTVESYFEYKISMNRADLIKGKNFIVDEKTTSVRLENGTLQDTKWYQFRVPIVSGVPINGISDFNSIRFMRLFLTNFKIPIVLRFGELNLVRGDWRRYTKVLDTDIDPNTDLTQTELTNFEVGVVNIEQNEERYALPPGIVREQLQGSTTIQQQNEQSVTLKVKDLPPHKVRAIYKNISIDLRRFKQLKMFMHLEEILPGVGFDDDELSAIIRLGTDLNDNFYQIEIPLKVTKNGTSPLDIWPEANNLDAMLSNFGKVKLERDALGPIAAPINKIYTSVTQDENQTYTLSVKGNPTLAQLRTIMLGIKNRSLTNKNAEIWFNELRAADFDNKGGWATVINADANLADVANISISGSLQTIGFGNVEDRVNQRSLDKTQQYDLTTNINLGKVLTPKKWGIQLPMNYSIGETFIDPKFDPQYQDVTLQDAFEQNPNSEFSRDYTKRTSISFVNIKKNKNASSKRKPKFYDVENISVSYAYNKEFHRDYNIQKYINENVTASASYNFNFQSKPIEPFKNATSLTGKYWQFIRDINFNFIPKRVALNSRINRSYSEQQSRNLIEGLSPQPELKLRQFLFDWDYTIGFDLTKSLQLDFNASNSSIFDVFESEEELTLFDDFFNTGRPNHYHQKLNATYKLPIDKIPFLNFIKADYLYTADFDWQASSQDIQVFERIGNVVQNANTHAVNSSLNFARFYDNLGLKKILLSKKERKKNKESNTPRLPSISKNKKKKLPLGKKIIRSLYDVITSVKQGKISYSENNGQLLPGYAEPIGFLGGAPLSFAFGSQVDIRNKALINGWLIDGRELESSEYYNKTYSKTHYNKIDYTFAVKPFKDLTIDVRGNKIKTRNLSQQLDVIARIGAKDSIAQTPFFETGNFSTSHSMISTAFTNGDVLFQKMKDYRKIISNRLATENGLDTNPGNFVDGFGKNSQQVVLPAFIAAYSGRNPNTVSTGLFKNIPIPNWTLRYNGLMKFKWFKKKFSNFVISHGYRSSYTISSFTNNLAYESPTGTRNSSEDKDFEPQLLIAAATLVDEFSPLIKIDMKMKNSFSFRGEIKKDRTLTMNFNNSTLTDIKGTEYVFGLGYIFKNVQFRTRFTGKKQTLKGDINLRADVSLRDDLTQIRTIDDDNNQISGGQKLFSVKFTADYRLSSNLTASFYYNHQASKYAISTTFPRQSINSGLNIIYNLGN